MESLRGAPTGVPGQLELDIPANMSEGRALVVPVDEMVPLPTETELANSQAVVGEKEIYRKMSREMKARGRARLMIVSLVAVIVTSIAVAGLYTYLVKQRVLTVISKSGQLWSSANVSRGTELLSEGKDEEAKAQFALALEHEPSDIRRAFIHNEIAWLWFLRSKPAEALVDADKAVALAPNDHGVLDTRGQIFLALGRFAEAFVDLDNAISNGAKGPRTYVGRGLCFEQRGNRVAAVADYRDALRQHADEHYEKAAQSKARERLSALGEPLQSGSTARK